MTFQNKAPLARTADPHTSHLAGNQLTASGERSRQKKLVLDALRDCDSWYTSAELSHNYKLDRHMVARRLPDLRRDGLVKLGETVRCSMTNRLAMTWKVA